MKYRAIVDYELAMTQARFQTLAIFLAAVGFVVGRGDLSSTVGALLLLITLGLWIVDIRNRDVLYDWRRRGRELEYAMGGGELEAEMSGEVGAFGDRNLPVETLMLGLFWEKRRINGRIAGFFVHQFGVDVIFSAVIGFSVALIAGESGWLGVAIVAAVVAVALFLTGIWALWAHLSAWWARGRNWLASVTGRRSK